MPSTSKSQQRFMGMVRATQKGELKSPSPSISRAAKSMSPQDAHDFAATKHTNLPEKAAEFARKMAYVQLNPTNRVASKKTATPFQHPPSIGQRKATTPVPPATADAKMVMRSAPSVPNPIVPAAQSGSPMPVTKVAASPIPLAPHYTASGRKGKKMMPQPHARQNKPAPPSVPTVSKVAAFGAMMANNLGYVKLAVAAMPAPSWAPSPANAGRSWGQWVSEGGPLEGNNPLSLGMDRLTGSGPGAIPRPQPPATSLFEDQVAAARKTPFAAQLDPTGVAEQTYQPPPPRYTGPQLTPAPARKSVGPSPVRKPIGTPPVPTSPQIPTVKPAPVFEDDIGVKTAAFGAMMAGGIEKQALGGLGTLIGAGGGTYQAPGGHKMEGLGRGTGQGLGWDVGGQLGALGGSVGGAFTGAVALPALVKLVAALRGQDASGTFGAAEDAQMPGALGGSILGGLGGYVGGGMLGHHAAKSMMGEPSWEDEQTKKKEQGNLTAAQLAAP